MHPYLVSRRRVSALARARTLTTVLVDGQVELLPSLISRRERWTGDPARAPKTQYGVRLQCSSLFEYAPLAVAFGFPWFRRLVFGVFIILVTLVRV